MLLFTVLSQSLNLALLWCSHRGSFVLKTIFLVGFERIPSGPIRSHQDQAEFEVFQLDITIEVVSTFRKGSPVRFPLLAQQLDTQSLLPWSHQHQAASWMHLPLYHSDMSRFAALNTVPLLLPNVAFHAKAFSCFCKVKHPPKTLL